MHFALSSVVLVTIISLQNILGEGPPRVLHADDHRRFHFAAIKEPITLKCPIENTEEHTFVEWMKGNKSLYTEQGYQITGKGFLKIKSVSKHHSGTYTCEAVNGYGLVRVNLTLIIDHQKTENQKNSAHRNSAKKHSYAPKIEESRGTADVALGGSANFHCVASGKPPPQIFWLREGELVPSASNYTVKFRTHSILKLQDVRLSDAGRYTCIAHNEQGENEQDFSFRVTEPSPPPRILSLNPPKTIVPEGTSATFVCDVFNQPGIQLHIKWLKKYHQELGDVKLFRLDNSYYRTLNHTFSVSKNGGTYKSKLQVQNASPEDSGIYVCLALNDVSYSLKNSTLVVVPKTTPFSSPPHSSDTASTSLALVVTVGFVVILAVVVFISHLFCSTKQSDRVLTTKAVDYANINRTSIKTPNRENLSSSLEIGNLQSNLKLLPSTGSTFIYEYSDSKMSQPNFGSQ